MNFWPFRRTNLDPVIKPPRLVFAGHDQSKGAQAFARSKAEALAIRRQARIDSRDMLVRVK